MVITWVDLRMVFIAGFTGAISILQPWGQSLKGRLCQHLDKWNASERRFKNTYIYIYIYVKKLKFKIFKTYIVQNGVTAVLPLICFVPSYAGHAVPRAQSSQATQPSMKQQVPGLRHPHDRMSKGRISWGKVLCQDLLTYVCMYANIYVYIYIYINMCIYIYWYFVARCW